MNARHSKATVRWGTPAEYVALARKALGGRIELDPMSEPSFNVTVGAERIYTKEDDCFRQPWQCETMLLNPAGGQVVKTWAKLIDAHASGEVKKCIWIGFSVEQLSLLACETVHPLDFSTLLVRKRISFVRHDGYTGAPGHANYVTGLGIPVITFDAVFAGLGLITHGRLVSR